MKQTAKPRLKVEFTQAVKGQDGYAIEFRADDSLAGWWSIVRWNLHYHHWRPLLLSNAPHLFTRVIWRKLWRRSA